MPLKRSSSYTEQDRRWRCKGAVHEDKRKKLQVCPFCEGTGVIKPSPNFEYRETCQFCNGEGSVYK